MFNFLKTYKTKTCKIKFYKIRVIFYAIIHVLIILFAILIIVMALFYFWYNNYSFAVKLVTLLLIIAQPLLFIVDFCFVRPTVYMYNMTLEEWKVLGVKLIMLIFIIIYLYVVYLFLALYYHDLIWLNIKDWDNK